MKIVERFKNLFITKKPEVYDLSQMERDINLMDPKIKDVTLNQNPVGELIESMCNGVTRVTGEEIEKNEVPEIELSVDQRDKYTKFVLYLKKYNSLNGNLPTNFLVETEIGITKRELQKFKKLAEEENIIYKLNPRKYVLINKDIV